MTEDEIMRRFPCPYADVEALRRRRASLRGVAHVGTSAVDRPDDETWVAKWQKTYAEEQKRKGIEVPPPPVKAAPVSAPVPAPKKSASDVIRRAQEAKAAPLPPKTQVVEKDPEPVAPEVSHPSIFDEIEAEFG